MSLVHLSRIITQIQVQTHQARFFARIRDPFPNKLLHYLRRAQLIDSIRLALRSDTPNSLPTLLNTRLLDPFVVIHALRSAPGADSAISLIESLRTIPNFSHTQSTLHALATVLAKSCRAFELKSLISEIQDGVYGNFRVSFMNLLQWYAEVGDLEAVLSTWNDYRSNVKSSNKQVCTESYNIVMNMYARMGKGSEAVEVFHRMIDEGGIPNSRTYTVIIQHLIGSGKLDEALETFSVLPSMRIKRTSRQYLVLIEGFVSVKRFNEVKMLLNEMKVDGKVPAHAMCVALQRLQEEGFIEETEEFLKEMFPDERIKTIGSLEDNSDEEDSEEVNQIDVDLGEAVDEVRLKPWLDPKSLANALHPWRPDVVSTLEDAKFVWTTRLVCKVLRNFNSPETAWNFFCWVAYQPGFTHDIYTVQRTIALLARHGKVELVDRLIAKIRSEGMRLPFSSIRLIIDFYGISKKADAALKIFQEDRTLCGPIGKFDMMLLYSSLLRTLTKCARNFDVINVLDEMISNGKCPDIQTFSGLMYHFALQGDLKAVQGIFMMVRQSGVEPDAYMFKILIQAYCKCQRASLALRVFEDMRNSKFMPDSRTKDLLVKSLWREGKRKEAAIVEESCEETDDVLPLVLKGHIWTVSSADLKKVSEIYSNSF